MSRCRAAGKGQVEPARAGPALQDELGVYHGGFGTVPIGWTPRTMQAGKIIVFVLFCALVVANLVVEVAWSFDERPSLDRYGWQPNLLYITLSLIFVQVFLYWLADRPPQDETRSRGFPVSPKDSAR